MFKKIFLSTFMLLLASSIANAGESLKTTNDTAKAESSVTSFDAKQQQDIGIVVHNYLLAHPEVLAEVAQKLRMKQLEDNSKDATLKINQNMAKLIHSDSPKAGNPKGTVYLVEFFDYQCGHCRNMEGAVNGLIQGNKNIQVIYKNLAVLGPNSQLAARAALAAGMQGKYDQMHEVLLKLPNLDKDSIMQAAQKLGIDTKKLESDMNSDKVNKELMETSTLASDIGIRGTPAFIVTPGTPAKNAKDIKVFFVPGEVPMKTLQDYINQSS